MATAMYCQTCQREVTPTVKFNWFAFWLFTVIYLPYYLWKKSRCPVCNKGPLTAVSQGVAESRTMTDAVYDVRGLGVQAMETTYIIATSKAPDTVYSRFQFLRELHSKLIVAASSSSFRMRAQQAIDNFKTMHYNTIPTDYQMQIVLSPGTFNVPEFYAVSLGDLCARYLHVQFEEIGRLKKEDAKQRRLDKCATVLDEALRELDEHCQDAPSYSDVRGTITSAREALATGRLSGPGVPGIGSGDA